MQRRSDLRAHLHIRGLLGCADALVRLCGGTVSSHLLGIFIGCSVHLDRDLLRRSRLEKVQRRSNLSSEALFKLCKEYRDAKTPGSANLCLKKIKTFDEDWVKSVEGNGMASFISKSLSTMSHESRSLAFADTNVVESQNRRGNVLIGTHNRPGEAARKLEDVDKLDLNSLREGQFNIVVILCGFRSRGTSILQPSGVAASDCGKRRRSKKGVGPVQKRARKKKQVTAMDNAMTCDESGGSLSKSAKGSNSSEGVETAGVDRSATASAHMDEMRVSAAAEEIRLSNRVEHEVSELLERAHKVPACRPDMSPGEKDALHESRMSSLIELLSAVNDSGHCIEKLKKALLDAMRVEQVRTDRHFRSAILSIFKLCMQPLGAHSTLCSNVAMTGTIPNTVCVEAGEDNRAVINTQTTENATANDAANTAVNARTP